jgi:hypothetical protein
VTAQRAFWGFDGVVDLSLPAQSVRGAVNRCFESIDSAAPTETITKPRFEVLIVRSRVG